MEKQTKKSWFFRSCTTGTFFVFSLSPPGSGNDGETWELAREDLDADERIGLGWGTRFDPSNTGGEIRVQQEILQG